MFVCGGSAQPLSYRTEVRAKLDAVYKMQHAPQVLYTAIPDGSVAQLADNEESKFIASPLDCGCATVA